VRFQVSWEERVVIEVEATNKDEALEKAKYEPLSQESMEVDSVIIQDSLRIKELDEEIWKSVKEEKQKHEDEIERQESVKAWKTKRNKGD
jgi:hypothetical protein|tara:strand:- start:492 stop:761 length:270 start_codon:yes stop_codon:yes gene_type:complete